MNKFQRQDALYEFPYHHLPHFDSAGVPSRVRGLRWGFEYLCYQKHIAQLLTELAPDSVLDVGCGDGRFIGSLDNLHARKVGVDLSQTAISFAKTFYPTADFRCTSIAEVNETFDVVVAIEVLEHIPDDARDQFITELVNRVRPGGHLVICVPTVIVPVHVKHYQHYDEDAIRAAVRIVAGELVERSMDHVYRPHVLLEAWFRITCNRYATLEFRLLNRLIWKLIWDYCRYARKGHGRHLVATFRHETGDR